MSEFFTTKELAEFLRIKERKVYDLAASGVVPCTRAMGKLLFPKDAVETWLEENSSGGKHSSARRSPEDLPPILLGSHDPLLEWALRESGTNLAMGFSGSGDGLERFALHQGSGTALHLFDAVSRTWNVASVSARFAGQDVVLVEWAKRSRGLVINPDKADHIRSLSDITGLRLAGRADGTGTQVLLSHLLRDNGIEESAAKPSIIAHTEFDAALALREGQVDVTFGLKSVANQLGLAFVPIVEERFDLLISRRHWFEEPFQTFWSYCQSDLFKARADSLTGYDLSDFGRVHWNG
ncbi:helix-turn-helix transcriptional regulator [Coralliovum pocilloporae]|uniref:helix-turn-helix transcriptional regulator n=1 Tax=Coralliovum pocilloporae TaxID=3066369 RepID=UPI0033074D67